MIKVSRFTLAELEAICVESGFAALRREAGIHLTVSEVEDFVLVNAFAPVGKLFFDFQPCFSLEDYAWAITRNWYSDGDVLTRPGTEARRFCKRHKLKLDSYVVSVMLCYLIPGAFVKVYQGKVQRQLEGATFFLLVKPADLEPLLAYFDRMVKVLSDTLFVEAIYPVLPSREILTRHVGALTQSLQYFRIQNFRSAPEGWLQFIANHEQDPLWADGLIRDHLAAYHLASPTDLHDPLTPEELQVYDKIQRIHADTLCRLAPLAEVSNCYWRTVLQVEAFEFKRPAKPYMGTEKRYMPYPTYTHVKTAMEARLHPYWDLVT